jgi:glycosyltransferase involved in cell wall biosynthesis
MKKLRKLLIVAGQLGTGGAERELVTFLSAIRYRNIETKVVSLSRGGGLPELARKHPARVRQVLRWANVVTSPSSFLAERMADYRDEIRVISNAAEFSRYAFQLRDHVKHEMIWFRAFDRIYNPVMAPAEVRIEREQTPAATLLMVGSDKDGSLEFVKAAARNDGVSDAIEFLDAVPKDRVPEILNRADIFLDTTSIDNTPVSVIEAMACGLCVVSTNVGGIPHLLEHEDDAFLVPPNDPNAMAVAVIRILEEPGLAGRLSTRARRKAEQFDWSVVLPAWEELFREVAGCA